MPALRVPDKMLYAWITVAMVVKGEPQHTQYGVLSTCRFLNKHLASITVLLIEVIIIQTLPLGDSSNNKLGTARGEIVA
jgi:hypothetical protein